VTMNVRLTQRPSISWLLKEGTHLVAVFEALLCHSQLFSNFTFNSRENSQNA
jgi:hypothetical protein